MSLDIVSRNKILGLLNKYSVDDLYYEDYFFALNTKKKYNDIHFLTFFVDSISNILSGKNNTSVRLLEKFLESNYIFLHACNEKNIEIDISLIVKMQMYKEDYQKYCQDCSVDVDNQIIIAIDKINSLLQEKYEEQKDEDNSTYGLKLKELEAQLAELKKDNALKEIQIQSLEKIIFDGQKKVSDKNNELSSSKKDLEEQKNESRKLAKKLKDTEQEKLTLADSLEKLQQSYDSSLSECSDLRNRLEILETENKVVPIFNQEQERLSKEKFLDDIVLTLLLEGKHTINNLVITINENGLDVDTKDVFASLQRIKQTININNNKIISNPLLYTVCPPQVSTEQIMTLYPVKNKCIDFMFISDLHFTEPTSEDMDSIIQKMDAVYDYCAKCGISNIINLGDLLFDKNINLRQTRELFDQNLDLLNKIVEKLPIDSSITHCIIGGNHDRDRLIFGIDPIKYVCERRQDMINLGYDRATIKFHNSNKDCMTLHHVSLHKEDKDFNSYSIAIKDYLTEYYQNLGKETVDSYIDFFGHKHISRLDNTNYYCMVPSLTKDRNSNGAWHVKVYFDENKNIKYMIFIALSVDKEILPVTEMAYQKIKVI